MEVVGSVVGGLIGADGAKDAADTQAAAADRATQLQKEIFDKQVALQEPWRQAGMGGLNRLAYLMGLSPVGYGGSNLPTMETAEQIRARLLPKFTPTGVSPTGGIPGYPFPAGGQPGGVGGTGDALPANPWAPTTQAPQINEAGLQAAIDAEMAKQKKAYDLAMQGASAKAGKDQQYGSLLDKFSMEDFEADPGYQFRMEEGNKALDRRLSAGGKLFSGSAIKDTLRFNQGLAAQEYGAAFDRNNVQNTNTFNRLASIAGIGQTAANQTGAAAANYGNNVSSNIIGAGNAGAAGRVGAANALSGGIGQGISMYQNNQMMNRLFPAASSSFNFGSYNPTAQSAFNYGASTGNWLDF